MGLRALVILDDRQASSKQSIALAELLGVRYETVNVQYTFWSAVPGILPFGSLSIRGQDRKRLLNSKVDLVISAGRRLARVSAWLKKKRPHLKNIHILKPDISMSQFDILVLPKHDITKRIRAQYPNIVAVDGAVVQADNTISNEEKSYWERIFRGLRTPLIALIIGGSTSKLPFMEHHARDLANKAYDFAQSRNGSLLVMNNKNTGDRLSRLMFDILAKPNQPIFIHDINSDEPSPFKAFLYYADIIITTGESISTCAECVASGKPVLIYTPNSMRTKKNSRYFNRLFKRRKAASFTDALPEFVRTESNNMTKLRDRVLKLLDFSN